MNMNKPRNNTRIESQLQHLKTLTRPQVTISPTRGDPVPVTNNGRFISRRVNIPALSTSGKLTIGDISTALKNSALNGPTGDFFIKSISLYCPASTSGSFVKANVAVSNLLTSGRSAGGSDQIFAEDYGTWSRLAGFKVSVPALGSLLQNFDTASTTDVLNSISVGNTGGPITYVTVLQQL